MFVCSSFHSLTWKIHVQSLFRNTDALLFYFITAVHLNRRHCLFSKMAAEVDIETDDKDRLLPDIQPNDEKQGTQDGKLMNYVQCCKFLIENMLL